MEIVAQEFNNVSLLITHYNRSRSLERLLKTFSNQHIHFGEIIVSDDGSKQEHLDLIHYLQQQYHFRLVTTPVNKGLGNNINKGQDAVIRNSGVGTLQAGSFIVQTMNIDNSGVGAAEVYADKNLKVKDTFLGKVKNRGSATPRKMNKVRV